MDYRRNGSNNTLSNINGSITNSSSNNITFLDGIEIIGKLIIPENYQIHIETTTIIVQGMLEMTSTAPITGQPMIQITMISSTKTADGSSSFTPVYENALACVNPTCDIGSKGIIVAGGSLNS
jgi:hypothetical protein